MIRIYPEQLTAQLADKLRPSYLIFGNDPLLSQQTLNKIVQVAQQQGFTERYTFFLDHNTDWDHLYSLSKSMSLFSSRQIMILQLVEKGPTSVIADQLLQLAEWLHPDLLLILCGHKLNKVQEHSAWCQKIAQDGVYINCLTLEPSRLPQWVNQQAQTMSLTLAQHANNFLCDCYEGNLLALNQALERLSLLYPDGNITLHRVQKSVNNFVKFTPYQWVDALLLGETKRSWHILQQLQQEGYEAVILLRTIQHELILLWRLKQQKITSFFHKKKILPGRRHIIITALDRLSLGQLQLAIQLMTQAEFNLKTDYSQTIWQQLEILSMLLCGKSLPDSLINDAITST